MLLSTLEAVSVCGPGCSEDLCLAQPDESVLVSVSCSLSLSFSMKCSGITVGKIVRTACVL